jgi:8-oxo-dGTP pyrophosphatase MutT (NUDIX family)
MLPLFRGTRGELRLLLVQRGAYGSHPGDLALPGGKREEFDADPAATALREAVEELGVEPSRLEILGALAPVVTASTGYLVRPFVAAFHGDAAICRAQPGEIDRVIDLEVAQLAAAANLGERQMQAATWSAPRRTAVRVVGDRVIWGLTLRILEPVLEDALAGRWPV